MSEQAPKRGRGRPRKERGIGDNSGVLSGDAQRQVKQFSARVIELMGERDEVNHDIGEVFKEAKDAGLDTKIMRKAIKLARMDQAARKAEEDMIDMYLHAVVGELLDSFEEGEQPNLIETQPDEPPPPPDPVGEESIFTGDAA